MQERYATRTDCPIYEGNGWGGIRTPGAFRHTRFPGVHNQPLCHPSIWSNILIADFPQGKLSTVAYRFSVVFVCSGGRAGCNICEAGDTPAATASELQAPEQFVEWQLNADVKFAEIRVLCADGIETHFVNDRFDLECVARKQRHAPFRVI
jgi:hypothetical protein